MTAARRYPSRPSLRSLGEGVASRLARRPSNPARLAGEVALVALCIDIGSLVHLAVTYSWAEQRRWSVAVGSFSHLLPRRCCFRLFSVPASHPVRPFPSFASVDAAVFRHISTLLLPSTLHFEDDVGGRLAQIHAFPRSPRYSHPQWVAGNSAAILNSSGRTHAQHAQLCLCFSYSICDLPSWHRGQERMHVHPPSCTFADLPTLVCRKHPHKPTT